MSLAKPNYWDGKFHKKVEKHHKICICTNVMGRLQDINQTLKQNISVLKDYPNIEFTFVNYSDQGNVDQWIKLNMQEEIEMGLLKYYRVLDPIKYYSMSHSRNICMRLAGGIENVSHDIIVNQVDADNFLKHDNPDFHTFPEYVNMLAQEVPEKCIFGKGKRLMHGRIGFYKDEFVNLLGGYDEGLTGYGHDDRDLYNRAMEQDFSLAWYGGQYVRRLNTSRQRKVANMKNKSWKETENINKDISAKNLAKGLFKANIGKHWGKANVLLNFKDEISI